MGYLVVWASPMMCGGRYKTRPEGCGGGVVCLASVSERMLELKRPRAIEMDRADYVIVDPPLVDSAFVDRRVLVVEWECL